MTVVDVGRNRARDLIEADVTQSSFGTGDTSPTRGDTDLESEVTATQNTPTTTTGNLTLQITGIMVSTAGNGSTFNESAVRMNSNNDLFIRTVFPDFTKNENLELHATDVVIFD